MTPANVILVGAPDGPRIIAFQDALARCGHEAGVVMSYADLLKNPDSLAVKCSPSTWMQFTSPDRDAETLHALYQAGEAMAREHGYPALNSDEAQAAVDTRGLLGAPAQLAMGLNCAILKAGHIAQHTGARMSAHPKEIALAFDKTASMARLNACGVPVPRQLGVVGGFDDLVEKMQAAATQRVFLKMRFGSSAAAMIALMMSKSGRVCAYTTAEISASGDVYTTRRVAKLEQLSQVRELVNRLAPDGLHGEVWIPKAGVANHICDLRVITISGAPLFNVLRMSHHPMTNLHLGGKRGTVEQLQARLAPEDWRAMIKSCRKVAALFPATQALGIDVAIHANLRDHAVLEVNAFGDFVKDVRYNGWTPQDWQISKMSISEMSNEQDKTGSCRNEGVGHERDQCSSM